MSSGEPLPKLRKEEDEHVIEKDETSQLLTHSSEICVSSVEAVAEEALEEALSERDEVESIGSDVSAISGFSEFSNHGWEPNSDSLAWLHEQMSEGKRPLDLLRELIPDIDEKMPVGGFDEATLWRMLISLMSEPARRSRLPHISSLTDAVHLIKTSKKILVLTGAGVSVSCGIPDFRSKDGVYSRLSKDFPDLPDPTAMFDIAYFRRNPRPFFQFAGELWPGQFKPSLCHRFIRKLEKNGQLLRNYTQNIDTLEQVAEIERVIQCHGSFSTATCMRCQSKVRSVEVEAEIRNKLIPICKNCHPSVDETVRETVLASFGNNTAGLLSPPVLKPDIVFFGEGLPDTFHRSMEEDKDCCDLLIVIGSSLKVRPVALIPTAVPPSVPQILINREPLNHMTFDVELLGDCDVIVNTLCHRLGEDYSELCEAKPLEEVCELPKIPEASAEETRSASKEPASHASTSVATIMEKTVKETSQGGSVIVESESLRISVGESLDESDDEDAFVNVAEALPGGTYFFERPGRYVFPGAEYFASAAGADEQSSDDVESDASSVQPEPSQEDKVPS